MPYTQKPSLSHTSPAKVYAALPAAVIAALNAAHSPNTVRAYKADLNNFSKWGGSLPSTPEEIASYMVDMVVDKGYRTSSITRALYALSHWHRAQHLYNPTADELVKQVRRGLRKTHGQPPQQSEALELPQLREVISAIGTATLIDLRDRALLTIGFFGAFRRSELVTLTLEQIKQVPEGIEISLSRSKANKFGELEIKPLVFANDSGICPITNLSNWVNAAGISEGPIFRRVSAHRNIGPDAISPQTLYNVIKIRVAAAGLPPENVSPHSLRAGFITTAYKAGKDRYRIKQVSGHKSDAVLDSYIRDADRFSDCAGKLD